MSWLHRYRHFLFVSLQRLSVLMLLLTTSASRADDGGFIVKMWQSEDGLPGSALRAIAQDQQGYLWVGAAEGLMRFDGKRFHAPYNANDMPWQLSVRQLVVIDNELWVAVARGGLLRYCDGVMETLWPASPEPNAPEITDIHLSADGQRLIQKGFLTYACPAGGRPVLIGDEQKAERAVAAVSAVLGLSDSQGRYWYQNASGQIMMQPKNGAAVALRQVPESRVVAFLEDRQHHIWVATEFSGLWLISDARVSMMAKPNPRQGQPALALWQDRQQAWWIGQREGSLHRLEPGGRFETFNPSAPSSVNNRAVAAILEPRDRPLMVALRDGYVVQFNGSRFVPFSELVNCSKVNAMGQSPNGTVWLGGAHGLVSVSPSQDVRQVMNHHLLAGQAITALWVAGDDDLWVGTRDGRVLRRHAGEVQQVGDSSVLGASDVSALYYAADGVLYVATLGNGLHVWNHQRWLSYSRVNGLPDTRITSLIAGEPDQLWAGSLAGVLRFSMSELKSNAAPLSILWLNRSDGMNARECAGHASPAAVRGDDGRLYFSTTNGVAIVDPRSCQPRSPLSLIFEQLSCNGTILKLEGKSVHCPTPGPQRLTWTYTCPEYAAPEKMRFLTRLLPMQLQWQEASSSRQVSYESVPPGTYQLEVSVLNGEGHAQQVIRSQPVVIHAFWWEEPWALILVTLVGLTGAATLAAILMQRRLQRRIRLISLEHAREAERARIARDLHDDLGASLTEISLIANMNAPDDAGHPLRRIARKSQALVGTLDEIVWAINPEHDSTDSIVDYLTAFAGDFLQQANISLRLQLPREIPSASIDAERRHAIFLALREALNNLVKHSQATQANLSISVEAPWLCIVLSDNGAGFEQDETRAGNGLRNFQQRLMPLGGRVMVTSSRENGTRVEFALPWITVEGRSEN